MKHSLIRRKVLCSVAPINHQSSKCKNQMKMPTNVKMTPVVKAHKKWIQVQTIAGFGTGCRHTADDMVTRPRCRTLETSPTIVVSHAHNTTPQLNLLRGRQIKIPTAHHLNRKTRGVKNFKVISHKVSEFLFGFKNLKTNQQTETKWKGSLVASGLICPSDRAIFLLSKIKLLSFQE